MRVLNEMRECNVVGTLMARELTTYSILPDFVYASLRSVVPTIEIFLMYLRLLP